jgi:hypothetical protein
MPNTILIDGNWDIASPVGVERLTSPIPTTNTSYILQQDYVINTDSYAPLALNTPHPTKTNYKLVSESPTQTFGSGSVIWTRTYAQVPSSHDLFSSISYNFIGFWGYDVPIISANVGFVTYQYAAGVPIGRRRMPLPVGMRLQHDYFLTGIGGTYGSPGQIPIIQAQKYREKLTGFSYWTDVEELVDSGISGGPLPTTPTRTTYNVWVENARNLGWNSGKVVYTWIPGGGAPSIVDGSEGSPGQICAQDSTIQIWMGNIYLRTTAFVLAQ